jgi:hypothetical protein
MTAQGGFVFRGEMRDGKPVCDVCHNTMTWLGRDRIVDNQPMFRCNDCGTQFPPQEALAWSANARAQAQSATPGRSSRSPIGLLLLGVLVLAGVAYVAWRFWLH